jgi:hypothetical protein
MKKAKRKSVKKKAKRVRFIDVLTPAELRAVRKAGPKKGKPMERITAEWLRMPADCQKYYQRVADVSGVPLNDVMNVMLAFYCIREGVWK